MMLKKDDVIGLILVGLALAGIAFFFLFAPEAPQISYAPVEVPGSSLKVFPIEATRLSQVKVNATIVRPGFVTIHEAMGAAPGPVIGSSKYLEAGEYVELLVDMEQPLEGGGDYFALLFVDDGDKLYEPGTDLPVKVGDSVIKQAITVPL